MNGLAGSSSQQQQAKSRSPQPNFKSDEILHEDEIDEDFIEQEVEEFRRKLEKYHAQVIRKRKLKPHVTGDWIESLKSKLNANGKK